MPFVFTTAISNHVDIITDAANGARSTTVEASYTAVAQTLADLHATGDKAGIHTILSTAQGKCKVAPSWNIVRAGITSALKTHNLLFPKARNFATGKGAFVLESRDDAAARKAAETEEEKAIADASAVEQAAVAAAIDAQTTPADIAAALIAECIRLNLDPRDVLKVVYATLTETERKTA